MVQNVNQNINVVPNEPTLADLLTYFKKGIKLEFNCHHIGTVQSFDPDNQTATVTINYTQVMLGSSTTTGVSNITTSQYPTIVQAPCVCLGGGQGSLTFPISEGDECLVLFNDRDFDNWFAGSANSAPLTGRLHAFNDAVIIVGVRSLPNVLSGYNDEGTTLQFANCKIEIFDDEIRITATTGLVMSLFPDGTFSITNGTTEFVTQLFKLFTDIQNATTNTLLGPQPLVMPTFNTDLDDFTSFTT